MLINRHNYESFFLLYVDNELTDQEKEKVNQFVFDHADLKNELEQLSQTKIQASKFVAFGDFSTLLKLTIPHAAIDETNCMDWLLCYVDNELTAKERNAVEAFVQLNPHYAEELRLLQSTKFSPEDALTYGDKSNLLRKEKDDKVIPFPWWRFAAAAVFMGVLLGAYFLRSQDGQPANELNIAIAPTQNKNVPIPIEQPAFNGDSTTHSQKDIATVQPKKEMAPLSNEVKDVKEKSVSIGKKETKQKEENDLVNAAIAQKNIEKPLAQPTRIETANNNPSLQNSTNNNIVVPHPNTVIPSPKPQYAVYNPDAKDDLAKSSKNRTGRKLKRLLQRKVLGQESTDEGESKVTNIAFFQIETKTEEKKVEANEQKHK